MHRAINERRAGEWACSLVAIATLVGQAPVLASFGGTCAEEPSNDISYVRNLDMERDTIHPTKRARCIVKPVFVCDECIVQRPDIEKPWRYCAESPDPLMPIADPYYGFFGACQYVSDDWLDRYFNTGGDGFAWER